LANSLAASGCCPSLPLLPSVSFLVEEFEQKVAKAAKIEAAEAENQPPLPLLRFLSFLLLAFLFCDGARLLRKSLF
jgi:hypothetical protein